MKIDIVPSSSSYEVTRGANVKHSREKEIYKMKKSNFLTVVFIFALSFIIVTSNPLYAEEDFGGLGFAVAQIFDQETENHLGSLVVLQVIPDTPASKHNIKAGDIITHIDGQPTNGKTFEHLILNELRGPVGSTVELTVKRMEMSTPFSVKMNRAKITSP